MIANAPRRLADAVVARRTQLDLTQLEVWQAGGPSNTTLTEIENGRISTLSRVTARRLDIGLRWEAGSARRVWDGGEPEPLEGGRPALGPSRLVAMIDEYKDQHGAPSDASIARSIGVAAQTISSWRRRGLRELPEPDTLRSLARFIGRDYAKEVIPAVMQDIGYLAPQEDEAGSESQEKRGAS